MFGGEGQAALVEGAKYAVRSAREERVLTAEDNILVLRCWCGCGFCAVKIVPFVGMDDSYKIPFHFDLACWRTFRFERPIAVSKNAKNSRLSLLEYQSGRHHFQPHRIVDDN